jgi:hypothetical protein
MATYAGLFLLSAATLAFEITLTRIFSVAQFYHFAFMIVSLALLGFGASGTFLALAPRVREQTTTLQPVRLSWGFALAAVGSYMLTLYIPFDSFRIAHDWRQVLVLGIHYVALAAPFFFSGATVGLLLAARPGGARLTYGANLTGSATGCLLAVAAPSLVGAEGTVLLSSAMGIAAAAVFALHASHDRDGAPRSKSLIGIVVPGALAIVLALAALSPPAFLDIKLSPYKSLSYTLLYPDAEPVFQRWNGFSRVDVVRSSSIRSLPGRGFHCPSQPPAQVALTVDGDDLSPVSRVPPAFTSLAFTDCLLTALPYRLRPDARALVLEPRGGFDVLVALGEGAKAVDAVEANQLIVEAVRDQAEWAGEVYDDPRVTVVVDDGRAYARRSEEQYDVVVLSLTASQRPVTSGAYSLAEDYRYTVEAFTDYLARLDDGGLLVVTRWLQVPPSETIRAFTMAAEALERSGGDPAASIVALRSYQQMLILARRDPFTVAELKAVRAFAAPRAFDLVYAPDLQRHEVNQYNVLPEPDYYRACVSFLRSEYGDRKTWYRSRPFDVRPPRDDWPFFGHFFRWRQVPDVLAMAGHVWQPFGGAGYFVLLALMALAVLSAGVLILLPLVVRWRSEWKHGMPIVAPLVYFALLGLGYLFIEIPLLQRFILFLGHPTYALATVLFALLLFSGLGSLVSRRLPLRLVLLLLPALAAGYAVGLPFLFRVTMVASLSVRLGVAVVALAPLGLLMGMPFPKGVVLLEHSSPALVAWAWGVNGAVSVVASILAALLALGWGFSPVLALGAACYAGAWATVAILRRAPLPLPGR